MTWQSKEDQRDHIRSQLVHEIKNPEIWYPYADKLKSGLYNERMMRPEDAV